MWETWVRSLGWEDPLEKGTAIHSSIPAWRIPWTLQSMGSQRVRHDWATFTWPFSTKWSRTKANRVLPREPTGHSKCPLPTTQEKTLQHAHHQMVNTKIRLIIFFAAKDGEALYSQEKQDQELTVAQIMNLLIAKFRLKWKKVGKNIRPSSMT